MSVRRKTENRLSLIRQCHTCGRTFPTTASSPFMRQLYNVDGKKQKTCYFCSESCFSASYKHRYDGKAAQRRKEREAARSSAKNRRYYQSHQEQEKARARQRYWENHKESLATLAFNRRKRAVLGK